MNVTVDEPSLTSSSAGQHTIQSSVRPGSHIVSPISLFSNSDQSFFINNQMVWPLTQAQFPRLANSNVYQRTALEGPDGKHGGYRRAWRPDVDVRGRFDWTVGLPVVRSRVATKMIPPFYFQDNQLSSPMNV